MTHPLDPRASNSPNRFQDGRAVRCCPHPRRHFGKLVARLTKRAQASVALVLLCLAGCATTPTTWQPRTMPPCAVSLGSRELDAERATMAAMLALDAQGYAIVGAGPGAIEAQLYRSEKARIHWILRVRPDASISAEVSPEQVYVHRKTGFWYERLANRLASYRCRELEWLRWETQNRGLTAIAPALAAEEEGAQTSAGGEHAGDLRREESEELEVPRATALPPASVPLSDGALERGKKLDELYFKRSELHLGRAIAWSAIGSVLTATGVTLLVQGLVYRATPCSEDGMYVFEDDGCSTQEAGRLLVTVGGFVSLAGGAVAIVALPLLFSRLRQHKALGREIKALRTVELGVGAPSAMLGLTLRSAF